MRSRTAFSSGGFAPGFGYLVGGLVFGIALYRARVLARWAAALLAVGSALTVTGPREKVADFDGRHELLHSEVLAGHGGILRVTHPHRRHPEIGGLPQYLSVGIVDLDGSVIRICLRSIFRKEQS